MRERERDGNSRVASKMMPCKMGKRDGCWPMIGENQRGTDGKARYV